MKLSSLFSVLIILFGMSSVYGSERNDSKILVAVSIPPQAFFAEQIGGDCIKIITMLQPGDNPVVYEPKPSQMAAVSKASAYFAIGVPFEKSWLNKIHTLNSDMVVINTDEKIEKRTMENHACHENCRHAELEVDVLKKHGRISKDPHIWTSPPLVKIIAKNMADALIKFDSKNRNLYLKNLKEFEVKIDSLHEKISTLLKDKKDRFEFMVFHPSWGYFADTYGLTQTVIEIEGKEPKAAQLAELINYARRKGLKVIFVQPQFAQTSSRIIADAIDGHILFADPLEYDWLNNMKKQAIQFSMALK